MFRRLFTDIGISAFILLMIGSAYFMTAQRIIHQSANGFELCGQVDVLEDSLDKLKLRKGLIKHKDLPDHTKKKLIDGYNEQIVIFEEQIAKCSIL